MKELVVISGKGGTGKTSIVASLASLAGRLVVADCDVDAADLHLVLEPTVRRQEDFSGGSLATVMDDVCTGCGLCWQLCQFDAIEMAEVGDRKVAVVDPIACEGCGVCAKLCSIGAIRFEPAINGQWFVSDTRFGTMIHAKLGIAQENSGKLVSCIRKQAQALAKEQQVELILIDGSPGIGCPVIASIAGASLVLVVTEPTLSGLHDLERVAALTKHFGIRTLVCVNKWDINEAIALQIESMSKELGVEVVGRVRYDSAVTRAQIAGQSLVEFSDDGAAADVRRLWAAVKSSLDSMA